MYGPKYAREGVAHVPTADDVVNVMFSRLPCVIAIVSIVPSLFMSPMSNAPKVFAMLTTCDPACGDVEKVYVAGKRLV